MPLIFEPMMCILTSIAALQFGVSGGMKISLVPAMSIERICNINDFFKLETHLHYFYKIDVEFEFALLCGGKTDEPLDGPLCSIQINIAAKSNVYTTQWFRVSEIFDPRWLGSCGLNGAGFAYLGTH